MSKISIMGFCLFIFCVVFSGVSSPQAYAQDQSLDKVVKIRYLMAHKPDSADNTQLIQDFADRVKDRTKGEVLITPTMPFYKPDMKDIDINSYALDLVYSGEMEMGQIAVKRFAENVDHALHVMDVPMMFRDHDHAAKVVDGKIGQELMDRVFSGSNGRLKALAFTYSGGFRDMYSTKEISSLADLKGMPIRMRNALMGREFVDLAGMDPYAYPYDADHPEWLARHGDPNGLAEEAEMIRLATYKRYFPQPISNVKTVLRTHHSLYLTLVTINGPLFASLTPEQQAIIQEEASKLAIQERELSIRQEQAAIEDFKKDGVKFIELSDEDKKGLKEISDKVYNKYNEELGKWMDAIKAVQ